MDTPIEGLLFGTCVGDALGLPAEGLSRSRIQRRWGGIWKMRLVGPYGLLSDDTEHTVMVALSLLRHGNDVDAFQRDLARRLRWWFAALPPGTGLATARACIKLWLGFSPKRSGVFSAGNGPAMRSAIIGAYFPGDEVRRTSFVTASTLLTHTDPKALVAARAIAEAAAWQVRKAADDELGVCLRRLSQDEPWQLLMRAFQDATAESITVDEFAGRLGLTKGVSGYAYHTVPVALYGWFRHRNDFKGGLESLLHCGGDTDTVGAIAGGLLGLSVGEKGIPRDWLDRVADWPVSVERLRKLAHCFTGNGPSPFRWWHALAMPFRNLFMLVVVLVHGFRRMV